MAGFDHHLTKPMHPDDVEELLRRRFGQAGSKGTGA
jgi:hypothetical protein